MKFNSTRITMKLNTRRFLSALAVAGALTTASLAVQAPSYAKTKKVGGAAMYPNKTIVQNASTAPNLTTLVAAVKAAGLVDTLSGPGPFTVFAPTNDAFAKLPAGTVDTLIKPENKVTLTSILTYHVVIGKYSSKDIRALIKKGGGSATLKTVQGGTLTVTREGKSLKITDAKGGSALVTTPNVDQSNGVVHVIDSVLMPAS